ncbi:FtsK/SpoIIIE domain-containing protein [Ureaplasma canigenitalium]|uniref:FtsK/SpoIIIE domain-containing protein n=1 Tax=Ureaplasma canigenitalium TaxID=42092 RepID=UPI0004E26C77|nr:FtsK/SpoIIIE domain-containing protein [Ureaplasma canigenitalium]
MSNIEQKRDKKKTPSFLRDKTNKKYIIFERCMIALGFFLCLFSVTKVPYTGAILDSLINYFFGFGKFFVYTIILMFLICFYIKKARTFLFNWKMWLFYVLLAFLISFILGGVSYPILFDQGIKQLSIKVTLPTDIKGIIGVYKNEIIKENFATLWSKIFRDYYLISIGHMNYYFIHPIAFGGIIGYINLEITKAYAYVYIIIYGLLAFIFFITLVGLSNAKDSPVTKWKIRTIKKWIENINQHHGTSYALVNLKEHFKTSEDGVKNGDEIALDPIKDNEQEKPDANQLSSQPLIDTEQSLMISTNTASGQAFNDLAKQSIKPIETLNYPIQDDKNIIIENPEKQEFFTEEPVYTKVNDRSTWTKTKYFSFNDDEEIQPLQMWHTNNSANKYDYYPSTKIINTETRDYYDELKKLANEVKEYVLNFIKVNNLLLTLQNVVIYYSNFEIIFSYNGSSVSNLINNEGKTLIEELNKYFKLTNYIFVRGHSVVITSISDEYRSTIDIKEIIEDIPYNDKLCIGVGKNTKREVIWFDDEDSTFLIHGAIKRSGKAMLISNILLSALYKKSPVELDLYLINNGTKSYRLINNLHHTKLVVEFNDFANIIESLRKLKMITEQRLKLFKSEQVSTIDEYHKKRQDVRLPKILFVMSEYMSILDSKYQHSFSTLIQYLARNASTIGMTMILSTDYTNESTVSLKDAFNYIISLKLNTPQEGSLLMNQPWLCNLAGLGDMYIYKRSSNNYLRAQTGKIPNELFDVIVSHIAGCDYDLKDLRNLDRDNIKTKKIF